MQYVYLLGRVAKLDGEIRQLKLYTQRLHLSLCNLHHVAVNRYRVMVRVLQAQADGATTLAVLMRDSEAAQILAHIRNELAEVCHFSWRTGLGSRGTNKCDQELGGEGDGFETSRD